VRTCVRAVEQSKRRHSETKIAAAATELDIPVLGPITEHARYDLAFEIGGAILRVQCKWGALDNNGALIKVSLRSSWCTPSGYEHRQYKADEIDLVAVYCGELDRCYLLPHELAVGRRGIWLRLTPPKNAQRASVNLASQFEFHGAVAQLDRATRWQRVGQGFESPQLHSEPSDTLHVGAHECRNHFGYYLEKAGEGHEVLVSRRGRPYVRLTPVEPRLQVVAA
jgi:prevent-host-death family protein